MSKRRESSLVSTYSPIAARIVLAEKHVLAALHLVSGLKNALPPPLECSLISARKGLESRLKRGDVSDEEVAELAQIGLSTMIDDFLAPQSDRHNPDPGYLRQLLFDAKLDCLQAANRLGISPALMRKYLLNKNAKTRIECPYSVQFSLEALANWGEKSSKRRPGPG